MSNIQIRVIEDQHIEENSSEITQQHTIQSVKQNPFIDEQDQLKSYMNSINNNQHKFAPKPGDQLINREVKYVNIEDELNIQIEIRTDMPTNR